jgi:hypothetical protein
MFPDFEPDPPSRNPDQARPNWPSKNCSVADPFGTDPDPSRNPDQARPNWPSKNCSVADPFGTDPDPNPAIFVSDLQDGN